MAVSKRTRYEVLRRDNHTCRYCGGTSPDVVLTVDHVTPVALGGTDDPGNLVAACRDCNAGKSSTSPDAPLVADVEQSALRWSRAMSKVAQTRARQHKKADAYAQDFYDHWKSWAYSNWRGDRCTHPLPDNWESSVRRFYELGVPREDIRHCADVAIGNARLDPDDMFRYFAGCVWRVVTEIQDAAKQLLDAEDA